MKIFQTIFLLFSLHALTAQSIYEYEQKVPAELIGASIDINFQNKEDKIKLFGTLLCPKGDFEKVVMIVPGSGRDTRHSHFVLAEHFLQNNIAVYRFDERGIGTSTGKYDYTASTLIQDVVLAFQKLKSAEKLADKKIGILGHSLGGIASIGAYGKGCDFDFLIQMGTPVEKRGAFLQYQAVTNSDGFYTVENKTKEEIVSFIDTVSKMIVLHDDYKTIKREGKKIMKERGFKKALHIIVNPLQVDLVKQDHEATYKNCASPLLFIIGSEDRIVSSDQETKKLDSFNNANVDIKIIENVNHWLADKIGPSKMEKSLYHMNASAIKEIIHWVNER
jgi:alpha-beta hydrolase superfamily lysophospholipase